jgi:hypothetical protein
MAGFGCPPREWVTKIVPILKKMPLAVLTRETGISQRALISLRMGQSRPHPKNREKIASHIRKLDLI